MLTSVLFLGSEGKLSLKAAEKGTEGPAKLPALEVYNISHSDATNNICS